MDRNHRIHLDPNFVRNRFGLDNATILHTRDKKQADAEAFVRPLKEANAVFITGGRQWRLAHAYLNTKTYEESVNLLHRGGVIAGSSAGATIQGSFLVRGNSQPDNNKIMIGDHQDGFGLIKNAAIDQHLLELNRQHDMLEVIERYPELLGIGKDVNTSILVQGSKMTVFGRSYVAIYDAQTISREKVNSHGIHSEVEKVCLLRHGSQYDLLTRKVLK